MMKVVRRHCKDGRLLRGRKMKLVILVKISSKECFFAPLPVASSRAHATIRSTGIS